MSDDDILLKAQVDPGWLRDTMAYLAHATDEYRQQVQIAFYKPVNPMAMPVHLSRAREIAIVGGNRSSKTDTMLAELAIQMTGHIPMSLEATYPREKLRCPIRARVVCNSLTDTLEPIIKPKLRWDQWNGIGDPVDGRGHWGWVPRHCLRNGKWEDSYSEKYRTLSVAVDNHWVGSDGSVNRMTGWSTCQFLSYDQDLSAFMGTSCHFVGHDELPPSNIYRENRMRTLDVKGQIYTAFTPPDEVGASRGDVAWFFDEVYEKGLPGPQRDSTIESIILHTERNTILSPEDIQDLERKMTPEQREVRLLGRFIHLTGVIFSLFTSMDAWWCYKCERKIHPFNNGCPHCTGDDVGTFNHVVEPFITPATWPVVFVIDPHPRKKDAIGWFAITPSDDVLMIGEMEVEGTAEDVAREIKAWERARRIYPVKRLMDANIATETNDKLDRGWTMRRAYDEQDIRCDLSNDDMNVGIQTVNDALKPDRATRRPRLSIFNTCPRTIYSMGRWLWDEHKSGNDRELKEKPRDRHKDLCDVVRYALMERPTFDGYVRGGGVYKHDGRGPRGY